MRSVLLAMVFAARVSLGDPASSGVAAFFASVLQVPLASVFFAFLAAFYG